VNGCGFASVHDASVIFRCARTLNKLKKEHGRVSLQLSVLALPGPFFFPLLLEPLFYKLQRTIDRVSTYIT
jgi:hypothetical protein